MLKRRPILSSLTLTLSLILLSNVAHADESAAVEASEHIGSLANLIRKDDPPQAGLPAEFFQQLNPPNTSKV